MKKYFLDYETYTPIMNIVGNDKNLSKKSIDAFILQCLEFSLSTPRGTKKKVEYFNKKLGRYNIIKLMRGLYSWQQNDWCVYVSEKGFTFEVKENLNSQQALNSWKDFLLTMEYKNGI